MKKFISSITFIAVLCTAVIAQTSESFGGLGISVYPGKKGASVASVLPNSLSMLRGSTGSPVSLLANRNGKNILQALPKPQPAR